MGCLERYVLYGNALIGIAYAEVIAQHLGGHLLVLLLRYIKKNICIKFLGKNIRPVLSCLIECLYFVDYFDVTAAANCFIKLTQLYPNQLCPIRRKCFTVREISSDFFLLANWKGKMLY